MAELSVDQVLADVEEFLEGNETCVLGIEDQAAAYVLLWELSGAAKLLRSLHPTGNAGFAAAAVQRVTMQLFAMLGGNDAALDVASEEVEAMPFGSAKQMIVYNLTGKLLTKSEYEQEAA